MKQEELKTILERHMHWIKEDCEGYENMRADLKCAYLLGANLRGADLRKANFLCANLNYADLYEADLRRANLCKADLFGANLRNANLAGANLAGADLNGANLIGANLRGAKEVPFIPMACPDTGSFIAYKRASDDYIVKLEIPEDARRSSATGRKCRCDKAKVLSIQNIDGTAANIASIPSRFDETFIYRIGETLTVDDFDENRWNECAPGIHFFVNRQEAVDYIP